MINYIADETRAISNEIFQWFELFCSDFWNLLFYFVFPRAEEHPFR